MCSHNDSEPALGLARVAWTVLMCETSNAAVADKTMIRAEITLTISFYRDGYGQ